MPMLVLPDDVVGGNAWDLESFRHDNRVLLERGEDGDAGPALVCYALPSVRTMFVVSWSEEVAAGATQTFAHWLDEVTAPTRSQPKVRDRWRYDLAVAAWVREVGASRVSVCLEPGLRDTLAALERLLDVPDGTLAAPSPSKNPTASYASEPTLEAALGRELAALYPDGSLEAELERAAWPSLRPVGGRLGSADLPAELTDRIERQTGDWLAAVQAMGVRLEGDPERLVWRASTVDVRTAAGFAAGLLEQVVPDEPQDLESSVAARTAELRTRRAHLRRLQQANGAVALQPLDGVTGRDLLKRLAARTWSRRTPDGESR